MKKMFRDIRNMILVSGSLAYDRIMNFPGYFRDHLLPEKLHQISVSFFIPTMQEHFGGTAGNIAYNLALLGEKPIVLGSAGNDYGPYLAWQKKYGIDTSKIQMIKDMPTASAYIMTDKGDNQITAFHPGAMSHPITHNTQHITKILRVHRRYHLRSSASIAIVSPGNMDDMRMLPKIYKRYRIPYIYDPGQQIPIIPKNDLIDGLTGAKALILNDYELALLQKRIGFTKNEILKRVEILVTTLGEKGSIIETKNHRIKESQKHIIPAAKPKKVVDPTGAGDAYRAGFMYGLLREWPLPKVGRFASLVSVYTVEKAGTQTHEGTWANLRKRYKKNFSIRL